MQDPLVKWHNVGHGAQKRVIERLVQLREHTPVCVPRLLDYGWSENRLRLQLERVQGQSLHELLPRLGLTQKMELKKQVMEVASVWRQQGFIHGDLSLRNILVAPRNTLPFGLWFIDWVLDLKAFTATPRFAAREVYSGRRSFESDEYSIRAIFLKVRGN